MDFLKKSVGLSTAGPDISALGSHCLANFQPSLDCFIPNFKLKYENLENIKTDVANTVIFNFHQIKQKNFFGTIGTIKIMPITWNSTKINWGQSGRNSNMTYTTIMHQIKEQQSSIVVSHC